jgi:segregation and condensation protein A
MVPEHNQPYQVDLEVFRGPLDLLLYLVKKEEVDICDIPIARIAEQFKAYLQVLAYIDVEMAGDFLVLSSTLMEIKSKMLLPRPAALEGGAEEADADPRAELVRQLLQYRAFQTATDQLEALADRQRTRLPRQAPRPPARNETALRPVELWDLVSAFGRLMRETLAEGSTSHAYAVPIDQTPIHLYMEQIAQRLENEPGSRLPFSSVFSPPHTRARLVGLFLALLELTKRKLVCTQQETPFGDIWLVLVAPRR